MTEENLSMEEKLALHKKVSDEQKAEEAANPKPAPKRAKKEKTMSATKTKKAAATPVKKTSGRTPTKFRFRASVPKSVMESRGNQGIIAKILEKDGPLSLDELAAKATKVSDFDSKLKNVRNGIGQIIHGFKKGGYVLAEK
jgi:hypothetical protein